MHLALAAGIFALCAALGLAGADVVQAQTATPQPQAAQGPVPKGAPLASPEHEEQADRAMHSEGGRGGKDEPKPLATSKPMDDAVLVNGALNVPGAPKDSQTVPAKYSQRNAALDKLPIMAFPLGLNDAQRQAILASVRAAGAPVASVPNAIITQELPSSVPLHELPDATRAQVPGLDHLKYVRLENKILLVDAPNRIVVGVIEN
jgi:hypothetical protein